MALSTENTGYSSNTLFFRFYFWFSIRFFFSLIDGRGRFLVCRSCNFVKQIAYTVQCIRYDRLREGIIDSSDIFEVIQMQIQILFVCVKFDDGRYWMKLENARVKINNSLILNVLSACIILIAVALNVVVVIAAASAHDVR